MPKGSKVAKYTRLTYLVEFYQDIDKNPEHSIDDIKAKINELGGIMSLKETKNVDDKPKA